MAFQEKGIGIRHVPTCLDITGNVSYKLLHIFIYTYIYIYICIRTYMYIYIYVGETFISRVFVCGKQGNGRRGEIETNVLWVSGPLWAGPL